MAKHLLVTIILGMLLVVGSVGCKKDNADPSFEVSDLPEEGDVANGQQIFEQGSGGAAACSTCHSIDGVDGSAGPTLANFNERAEQHKEDDETVREYALNSIIAPGKFVVDKYRNTMPSNYEEKLSKQEIADVVAYLMTLD